MFRIGQKVVCVDAGVWQVWKAFEDAPRRQNATDWPVEGPVYTIIGIDSAYGEDWLALDGWGFEDRFAAVHFRPIVETKTDISVFEEILRRETIDDQERVS